MPKRRVVVTGVGVVAPNGLGKEAFWQALMQGLSGVRTIRRFDATSLPSQIAGEIVRRVRRGRTDKPERRWP